MKSLLRYTSLFLALLLLNCSVDAPDAEFWPVADNRSHNEQESIVELVVEKGLGYADAIPEIDDTDAEHESVKKNFSVDFYVLPVALSVPVVHCFGTPPPVSGLASAIAHIGEIHAPPPEA